MLFPEETPKHQTEHALMTGRISVFSLAIIACLVVPATAAAQPSPGPAPQPLSADETALIGRITAESLKGHVSFLASDLLEGRGTPSRGLDLAAEYISSQFRRAGLEAIGDEGYFQTARWREAKLPADGYSATLQAGEATLTLERDQISLRYAEHPIEIRQAPVIKVDPKDPQAQKAIGDDQIKGRVFVFEQPDFAKLAGPNRDDLAQGYFRFIDRLADQQAALVLNIDRASKRGWGLALGRLIDPEPRVEIQGTRRRGVRIPVLTVHAPAVIATLDALPAGVTPARFSITLAAPIETPVRLHNVVGLLRGSDPILQDTYVLVTAHYDHLGIWPTLPGDQVFNGANDDASGTASVIELAGALSALKPHPRRSLVFVTFFGEESGRLGSRYYARHPAVPIGKTVADINLEQVGRTDDSEGPRVNAASMTGFDYSTIGPLFREAGRSVGIKVEKHERNSDGFYRASDNYSLAEVGVPAHTICTAFMFSDYHKVGDHWDKLDYANMSAINRMIVLGLLRVGNDPNAPRWSASSGKTDRFRDAAKKGGHASVPTDRVTSQ
jgi:hypothetical protein